MRRFLFLAVGITATTGALVIVACSSTVADSRLPEDDDASVHKDGGAVAPADGGTYDGATGTGPAPSCATYCDLVMAACKGDQAQYASAAECNELCARLPLGDAGDTTSDSIACRQYYAGSPAQTDAVSYCLAAGPFGGGVCGDRCAIFCELTVAACAPEAGAAPYPSYPDCQTACAGFAYLQPDSDGGGGESPTGPTRGDTLNCRLFELRAAVHDGSGCAALGVDSGVCR